MIWSVIPEDVIFPSREMERCDVVFHQGQRVVAKNGRIESLLSTDPYDFLDIRYTPGRLL